MMARAVPSFRISGPAAASLLVNGLLVAALLNLGMGQAARRMESPALTVLSLAQLKGVEQGAEEAEAAEPSEAVSADPPPAMPPPPLLSAADPLPPPAVVLPSTMALPAPVQAVSMPRSTAMAARPSMSTAAAASPVASTPAVQPARRGTADGLDAQAPPGTSRSYAAKIRSWLYAHKIYPRRARMRREEGRVQVRFVLDRAGVLLEGAVIKGSGSAVLDGEAEAMMWRASPYPRVPAEMPGERIEFTAPIEFILPI